MTSKREREYQRKRTAKWQERQALARTRARKRRQVALILLAAVIAALLIVWALVTRQGAPSPTPTPPATATAPATTTPAAPPTESASAPDPSLAEGRTWTVTLTTNLGPITMQLDGAAAPRAVAAFTQLAKEGFYNGNYCHRLTTSGIFVLQCGDPTATPGGTMNGTGGPAFKFGPVENAPADNMYLTGTVAFARQSQNGNSMGSQFFIVWKDSPIGADSAGGYTVFGKVTAGLELVQQVAAAGLAGDGIAPATTVTIEKVDVK